MNSIKAHNKQHNQKLAVRYNPKQAGFPYV